jgi:gas vesicle protein
MMITRTEHGGSNGFLIGLVAGGAIGAALAIVFAPRANELRQRAAAAAADLTDAAAHGYQQVTERIAGVADGLTAKGQAVRDDVADAVGRGAREVEHFAMASKTASAARRS